MASIKFIGCQACTIFQYKNTRIKVLNCCANIYFNKQCLIKEIVPNYANIKLPNTSPAAHTTQKKIRTVRIKDEIKLLYKKKQKLNNELYKIHLKAAQEWGNSWYTILDSVIESTNLKLERKYKTIDAKLNKQCNSQNQNSTLQKQFYPQVDNRTNITFSSDELTLLNKGLKYNLSFKRKNWIKTLALEAETTVSYLPHTEREYLRYQIAHNIKQLYKHYDSNQGYNARNMNKERQVLHSMKNKLQSNNAVITKADKGNTIVVTYQQEYHNKIKDFIVKNNLVNINNDPTKTFKRKFETLLMNAKPLYTKMEVR